MKLSSAYLAIPLLIASPLTALATANSQLFTRNGSGIVSDGITAALEYQPAPNSQKRNPILRDVRGLTKRQDQYYIDQCPQQGAEVPPGYTEWRGSRCVTETWAGPWRNSCNPSNPAPLNALFWFNGACRAQEWCVNEPWNPNFQFSGQYPRAGCVTHALMQRIVQAAAAHARRVVRLTPQNPQPDSNLAIALSGENDDSVLFQAESITLIARNKNFVRLGQQISCQDCSTLTFSQFPAGTDNLKAEIVLPNKNDVAYLSAYSWYS
ncbi:hypothetical protein EV356DRAFT_537145 [Viridothelium virens]|uniref:Uncharacterized protein n=1 Tax=Viridothelium virens TaxID=1048519 RepID=A0A6A6GUU2_VIRVR|nr:hypothetical protein EV356DRAFT_537145 [Viridothelium virens]